MRPRCNRADGRRAGGRLLGDRRSPTATAEVRRGVQSRRRRPQRGRRRTGGPAAARTPASRPGGGARRRLGGPECPRCRGGVWSAASASPRRCHLPQGRPVCLLPAWEGGRTWLARARVRGSVLSVCIPRAAAGGGASEGARACARRASPCPPAPHPAPVTAGRESQGRRQRGLAVALGVTAEARQGRAVLWSGHSPESMKSVAPARPVRGVSQGCSGPWWESCNRLSQPLTELKRHEVGD